MQNAQGQPHMQNPNQNIPNPTVPHGPPPNQRANPPRLGMEPNLRPPGLQQHPAMRMPMAGLPQGKAALTPRQWQQLAQQQGVANSLNASLREQRAIVLGQERATWCRQLLRSAAAGEAVIGVSAKDLQRIGQSMLNVRVTSGKRLQITPEASAILANLVNGALTDILMKARSLPSHRSKMMLEARDILAAGQKILPNVQPPHSVTINVEPAPMRDQQLLTPRDPFQLMTQGPYEQELAALANVFNFRSTPKTKKRRNQPQLTML